MTTLAKRFLLRITDLAQQQAQWAHSDDNGQLIGTITEGLLSTAAPTIDGARVSVILPGSDVILLRASIPGSNVSRARKALPYALEESLSDDVETLHFAIGKKQAEDLYPVAVISRTYLEELLHQLETAGIQPYEIVPEPLVLPTPGKTEENAPVWSLLLDKAHCSLRQGAHQGFSCEQALLPVLLQSALKEAGETAPHYMVVYSQNDADIAESALEIPLQKQKIESPLHLIAQGIDDPASINLMQEEYSRKGQLGKLWKPWKLTAGLAAAVLVLMVTSSAWELITLKQQNQALKQTMAQLYKKNFPQAKRITNPKKQMSSRIRALKGGGGSSPFISTMETIAVEVSQLPGLSLQSINYRNGRMDVELTSKQLQGLEQLKQAVEKAGLRAEIQSANQQRDHVRGRIRIEKRS